MAVQGPIPVEFASVFPRGVFAAGAFEPVRDFEASKAGRFVQSKDKATGLPLWAVATCVVAAATAGAALVRHSWRAAAQSCTSRPSM